MPPVKYTYLVLIQGGLGPDVWDKEHTLEAADIAEAATMAVSYANEFGGWCVSVEQHD